MLKYLILIPILFLCFSCNSLIYNTVMLDEEREQKYLIGYTTIEAFDMDEFKSWYQTEYESYEIDEVKISELKQQLKGYKVTLVMGTWCSDSRREVPRFIKILNAIDYQFENLTIINVNRDKVGLGTEVDGLNIEFVPTIIVYKGNNEIGRIIESPIETLEIDLIDIITK